MNAAYHPSIRAMASAATRRKINAVFWIAALSLAEAHRVQRDSCLKGWACAQSVVDMYDKGASKPLKNLASLLLAQDPVAAFINIGSGVHLSPGPVSSRVASFQPKRMPACMLNDEEEFLQELPSDRLLEAIEECGNTATAADVAAVAGLEIAETRRQLLVLARLVGAELQVSKDGELLFVFDTPGAVRMSLRANSVRQRIKEAWSTVSPAVFWLLRASFGVGLIASLGISVAAIAAADSKENKLERGGYYTTRILGDSIFDAFYWSSRPYGYYGYGYTKEKGFLQSCFSLLFGDGDPNFDFDKRAKTAAAALIRANGGAVTAEQLAPIFLPNIDPEKAEENADRPGAPVNEEWMLPICLQFNGEPVVTDDGDLVYVFPELMATAAESETPSLQRVVTTRQQNAFIERPAPWRPQVGERVVTSDGEEGVLVTDERMRYEPLGIRTARGDAFYELDEVLPAGSNEDGLSLRELPRRFSTAPPSQLMMAGGLGALNLLAVFSLGGVLEKARRMTPLLEFVQRVYPFLVVYATGFVALPVVRTFITRRKNRAIEARNALRERWGRLLRRQSAIDVTPEQGDVAPKTGGFRARLKRKLQAAKKLRPRFRRLQRDAEGQYSTSKDLATAAKESNEELAGSGFDDFDTRLGLSAAEKERLKGD